VNGVGAGVQVDVLGGVSGKPLGGVQNGLNGLEGGLGGGPKGGPGAGNGLGDDGLGSDGLGSDEGLGWLLVTSNGDVGASVAVFWSRTADDVGATSVHVDGLWSRGDGGLDWLFCFDWSRRGDNEALAGRVEPSLGGGPVFDLPQLAGVVVVAVLALHLSGGVPRVDKKENF